MSAPGRARGQASEALVETVDVLPSLLELCGLPRLAVADGISFAPLLENPALPWKKAAFHLFNRGAQPGHTGPTIGRAVRTNRHRYVEWRAGWNLDGELLARELYDYESDPHERRNLASDAGQAATAGQLAELLHGGPAASEPPGTETSR